jgi:predicted amidohydrolase
MMRLALIQEMHNRLYDFSNESHIGDLLSFNEALLLQKEMLEQNFSLIEEAADKGADFLLTSEAINFPGPQERLYFPQFDLVNHTYDELREKLCHFAKERRVWIAAGLYRPIAGNMRNSLLIINREGEIVTIYDKIHLAGSEKNDVIAGDSFCCFDSEFGRIGICICWDMQFPETCRILALQGAKIILCPTWGWEWLYAGCRAYENGIYAAGAMAVPYNNIIQGLRLPSSVINPEGMTIAQASANKAEVLYCDVDLNHEWDVHTIRMNDRRSSLYGEIVE